MTMSLIALTGCSKGLVKGDKPLICPSTAYVEPEEFRLGPLKTKGDVEFHQKANTGFAKLADLLVAYTDLRGCVDEYNSSAAR